VQDAMLANKDQAQANHTLFAPFKKPLANTTCSRLWQARTGPDSALSDSDCPGRITCAPPPPKISRDIGITTLLAHLCNLATVIQLAIHIVAMSSFGHIFKITT
jgi:hypothetical protein